MGGTVETMEVKKAQPAVTSKAQENTVTSGKVVEFLGDVKAELKKISWTTPEELRVYTKLVVAMTLFLGLGIYVVDLIIQSILGAIHTLFGLIT